MNAFKQEPQYTHGQQPNVGVLILNLGTPSAPNAKNVRRYLKEFLSDRRVVEVPKIIWWFILHGIILPFRSKQSALKYASVWTEQGSPLLVNTQQQYAALQTHIQQNHTHATHIKLAYAMRYNQPSVEQALEELRKQHIQNLIIFPLYPQYCSATTGSTLEKVFDILKTWRVMPAIRTINRYHDHPAYIDALKQQVLQHWQHVGMPDFSQKHTKLLMSFHGVPQRNLTLGDYYHCECYKTARLLAQALNLNADDYTVSFQSRLGRAKWLQPYTEPTLEHLAQNGVKRVDVICPGFSSDCLETLEEIAMEAKATFMSHGGQHFEYIPCLNATSHGMQALYAILTDNLQGIRFSNIQDLQAVKMHFDSVNKQI
jgi:protoporphyrin/coproporphyrin ferrochelatase